MSSKHSAIGKVGSRRQVVIPKPMCENLGLGEGDLVELTPIKNGVVIRPTKRRAADDVITPNQAKLLRKAESQMRRGEYVTLDELEANLGSETGKRSRKTA
jgi:AbrB family looped-hinge helix DNA binding protein